MPKYNVRLYTTGITDVVMTAVSKVELVKRLLEDDLSITGPVSDIDTDYSLGMPESDDPELWEELVKAGVIEADWPNLPAIARIEEHKLGGSKKEE